MIYIYIVELLLFHSNSISFFSQCISKIRTFTLSVRLIARLISKKNDKMVDFDFSFNSVIFSAHNYVHFCYDSLYIHKRIVYIRFRYHTENWVNEKQHIFYSQIPTDLYSSRVVFNYIKKKNGNHLSRYSISYFVPLGILNRRTYNAYKHTHTHTLVHNMRYAMRRSIFGMRDYYNYF